jgi:hypothetical protein
MKIKIFQDIIGSNCLAASVNKVREEAENWLIHRNITNYQMSTTCTNRIFSDGRCNYHFILTIIYEG